MPRRKANQQDSISPSGEWDGTRGKSKKAKTGGKGARKSPVLIARSGQIPTDNVSSNKSLDALFHITDLELQNISKNNATTDLSASRAPALEAVGPTLHQVVRLPGQEKGVEKYQLKSDSLEEQGLKLVYTKHTTSNQYQPNPVSYGSYRPRGFKEQSGGTVANVAASPTLSIAATTSGATISPQIFPEITVGRKRKHPQKPGRHICPYCQRGCAKPSVLQKHIRAHTGERPYPCVPCGFSFKTKSNLYKHCKSRAHAIKIGQSPNFEDATKFGNDEITDSEDNGSSTDTDAEGDSPAISVSAIPAPIVDSKPITTLSSNSVVYHSDKAYYDIVPATSDAPSEVVLLAQPHQQQQQQQPLVLPKQPHQQPAVIVLENEPTKSMVPPLEPTEATAALRQLEDMSDELAQMAENANVLITSSVQTLPDKLVRVTIQLKRPKAADGDTASDAAKPQQPSDVGSATFLHSITKPVDHKTMSSEMLRNRIQQLIVENQAIVDTAPILDPPRQKRLSRQNSETAKSGNNSPKNLPSTSGMQKSEQSFLEITEASDRPPELQMNANWKSFELGLVPEIQISLKLPKPVENVKSPMVQGGSVIKQLLSGFVTSSSSPGVSQAPPVGANQNRIVDNYGPYLCHTCNVSFRKDTSLQMHQRFYCPELAQSENALQAAISCLKAEREREILDKVFPEVPVTPVSPTKFSYSSNGTSAGEVGSPKKKGKPKLTRAKTRVNEDSDMTPVLLSTNPAAPTLSGGQLIKMSTPSLPAVVPIGPPIIVNKPQEPSPVAPIIVNEMHKVSPFLSYSGSLLKRSLSVPASAFASESSVLAALKAQITNSSSIHSKIETIISNTTTSSFAASTSTTSIPSTNQQEILPTAASTSIPTTTVAATTSSSAKSLWKLQLRGKLLMKRSMSVERMLSNEETDKSLTPTKVMSRPNLTCPLPPEAPRLMRSITVDASHLSRTSVKVEPKIRYKPIAKMPESPVLTVGPQLSLPSKSSAKIVRSLHVGTSSSRHVTTSTASSVTYVPLAQAGSMPLMPSIIQGSIIKVPMFRAKSLETVTLATTSQGTCIVLPHLSLPPVPPHHVSVIQTSPSTPKMIVSPHGSLPNTIKANFNAAPGVTTATMAKPSSTEARESTKPCTVIQNIPHMLAGHNLPSLRSSTHATFCCVQQSQPMYVQQGSNRKISMYSNWRVAAYNPNPQGLTAGMLFSLYRSRQYAADPTYAMSKVGSSQPGSLTHSSYWNYYNKLKAIQSLQVSPSATDETKSILGPAGDNVPSTAVTVATAITSTKTKDGAVTSKMKKRLVAGGYKSNDYYVYVRGRGRGKYVCEECGIRCKKPSMLKKHIRTHTDLRPYSCKHCNFSFKTKGNLTKHMKSKAHSKRCTELGIVPVPTMVDDSQIDNEALERQQEISRESKILEDKRELKTMKEELNEQDHDGEDDDHDEEDDDEDEEDDSEEESCEDDDEPSLVINEELSSSPNNTGGNPTEEMKVDQQGNTTVVGMPLESGRGLLPAPGSTVGNGGMAPSSGNGVNEATIQRQAIDAEIARSLLDLSKQATDHSTIEEPKHSTDTDTIKTPQLHNLIGSLMSHAPDTSAPTTRAEKRKASHDDELEGGVIKRANRLPEVCLPSTLAVPSQGSSAQTSVSAYHLGAIFQSSSSGFLPPVVTSSRGPIIGQLISNIPTPTTSQTFPFQFIHPFPRSLDSPVITPVHMASEEPVNLCVKDDANTKTELHSAPITRPSSTHVTYVTSDSRAPFEIQPIPGKVTDDSETTVDGKFVCGTCQKTFSKQAQLNLHRHIHFFENPFKCTDCTVSFKSELQLEKHRQSDVHSNRISAGPLQSAPSADNPRPYRCEDCGMGFRIQGHLAKHLRSKTHIVALEKQGKLPLGSYEQIQRMSIDLKDCDTLESLRAIVGQPDVEESQLDLQDSDVTSPTFSPPPLAGVFELNSQASNDRVTVEIKNEVLEMYDVRQHGDDATEELTTTVTTSLGNQVDASSSGTEKTLATGHQCSICENVFANLTMLKQHLVSHAELRPHVCEYCDAGFTTAQSLKVHLRTHTQVRAQL